MKITLNRIRCLVSCESLGMLLLSLGKKKPDNAPLDLIHTLNVIGINETLRCVCAVKGHEREKRLLAVFCARQAQEHMADERSRNALDVAERYANGEATLKDLKIADDAAYTVAYGNILDTCAAAHASGAAYAAASVKDFDVAIAADAAVKAVLAYSTYEAAVEVRRAQETELRRILSIERDPVNWSFLKWVAGKK